MLVIGTKPEYFNAVWVKNEWSRYLDMMKSDKENMQTAQNPHKSRGFGRFYC